MRRVLGVWALTATSSAVEWVLRIRWEDPLRTRPRLGLCPLAQVGSPLPRADARPHRVDRSDAFGNRRRRHVHLAARVGMAMPHLRRHPTDASLAQDEVPLVALCAWQGVLHASDLAEHDLLDRVRLPRWRRGVQAEELAHELVVQRGDPPSPAPLEFVGLGPPPPWALRVGQPEGHHQDVRRREVERARGLAVRVRALVPQKLEGNVRHPLRLAAPQGLEAAKAVAQRLHVRVLHCSLAQAEPLARKCFRMAMRMAQALLAQARVALRQCGFART